MKNKKNCKIWVSVLLVAIIAVYPLYFVLTTKSDEAIERYMINNSQRSATEFVWEDMLGTRPEYNDSYWFAVAANGDDTKGQEAYIIKVKPFPILKFLKWDRCQIYAASTNATVQSNDNVDMGVIQFTLRDNLGKKEPGKHLLFFSNKGSAYFDKMTYTVTDEDNTSKNIERYLATGLGTLAVSLDWQGIADFHGYEGEIDGKMRTLSDIKFYDKDGKVVYEY